MAIVKVPVTKGKDIIEVDTDVLPDAVYQEIVAQGLKVLINRGTTKITKVTYPDPEEMKAKAMEQAQKQLADMVAGKIRIMGAKADKTSGAVMTEARRIARNLVKDELKRQKIKVSYCDAKDITMLANKLIHDNPELLEQAKQTLAERDQKAAAMKDSLSSIAASVQINPKKQAAAEAEKARAKDSLSKMQAGKTQAARQRPTVGA